MAEQLVFDLPVRPALGRADFFVAPSNAMALAIVDGWRTWPQGKLVLTGPNGSGKSHLAQVWASETGARVLDGRAIDARSVPDHAAAPALVVEDADRSGVDDEALFHLHNLCAADGVPLLLTAATPPRDWPVTLPDLRSRMSAATVATLAAPDDSLLAAVIRKQFADRQVTVSNQLIAYLVTRIERTFDAAIEAAHRLDRAALAEGRPVSRSLAARVMDQGGQGDA